METAIMLWIHRHANPTLDAAFVFSWLLGSLWFCGPLTLFAAARHLRRGERREAAAWLGLAIAVAFLPELLKILVRRSRPTLWPWLLPTFGYSFPSGHAMAGAALYSFLGWLVLRSRNLGAVGFALGFAIGAFVGVGRMYVGVHWPSDVAAGWALGLALSGTAVSRLMKVEAPRA
jgi:membrane-associated phospholipid phosphatase